MDYYNRMSPFPPYDTDYVKDVAKEIETIKDSDIDYDMLPVDACTHCLSLFVTTEEEGDSSYNLCNRCLSVDDLITFENIHKYNEYLKQKGYDQGN